ncbi:hypothetical protein L6R52_13250 [Myxococcota bacterium]|nr:hypothetical protein [Myxococcota bacterium]
MDPNVPEVVRPLWIGAVCLAAPMLLYTLLYPVLGGGFFLFILFFVALIPGTGAALVFSGGSFARIMVGALVMLLAAFASIFVTEARIFGPITEAPVNTWRDHPIAAGFVDPSAAPSPQLQRTVTAQHTKRVSDARGQTSRPYTSTGTFTVAPIVARDPSGDPRAAPRVAHAVAIVEGSSAPAWASPGGLLRLLPDGLHDAAVDRALAEAGLTPAPHLVIGRWVAHPGWARLDAAKRLLLVFGGAFLLWTLLILHHRLTA